MDWFKWIFYVVVVLFVFLIMIFWFYYGECCWSGLFGLWLVIIYKVLFLIFVVLGLVINLENVFNFSDMLILGMVFFNLLGGVIFFGKVKVVFDDYLN